MSPPAFPSGWPDPKAPGYPDCPPPSGLTIRQYYKAAVAGAIVAKCTAMELKDGIHRNVAEETAKVVDALIAEDGT